MRFTRALLFAILIISSLNLVRADDQSVPMQVNSIAIDSEKIYAAAYVSNLGGRIRVYSKQTNELVTEINIGDEPIPQITLSQDKLYAVSYNGKLYEFSLRPEISLTNTLNISLASSMWVKADDKYVYTYSLRPNLTVWNRSDLSLVKEIENMTLSRFVFDVDENFIYGAQSNQSAGSLRVWNKSDWSLISTTEIGSSITRERGAGSGYLENFYMDDKFIYTAFNDGRYTESTLLEVWNKSDLSLYLNLTVNRLITSFASDSEYLYAAVKNRGEVIVYRKPNLEQVTTIVYDQLEMISSIEVYGDRLFTGSQNGTIKVWDIPDFSLVSSIGEPITFVESAGVTLETAINPLPPVLLLAVILLMNALLPKKSYDRLKKRFNEISINDILSIVLVAGVILLVVGILNPKLVSARFSWMTTPDRYFNVFVHNSSVGYYWFILWSVIGCWLARKKGRKIASALSMIFLIVAYVLFLYIQ